MGTKTNNSAFPIDSDLARQITLLKVWDEASKKMVMDLRYAGYEGAFDSPEKAWDEIDRSNNTHVLLALDQNQKPIGTIRIIDGRNGSLEVDTFTQKKYVDHYDKETVFVESSRLVVSKNISIPKRTVQAALWKAVHRYAYAYHLHQLIAWVKTGPDRAYQYLKFDKLEGLGFTHPALGDKHHEVYCLDITKSEEIFRSCNHPMWKFFFLDRHENLIWY